MFVFRVCRAKVTETIRILHRNLQAHVQRPNFDNDQDDRDAMIDYFCPDLTKEQTSEANETYELLF